MKKFSLLCLIVFTSQQIYSWDLKGDIGVDVGTPEAMGISTSIFITESYFVEGVYTIYDDPQSTGDKIILDPSQEFIVIDILFGKKINYDKNARINFKTGLGYINGAKRGDFVRDATTPCLYWCSGIKTYEHEEIKLDEFGVPLYLSFDIFFKFVSFSIEPRIYYFPNNTFWSLLFGLNFGLH